MSDFVSFGLGEDTGTTISTPTVEGVLSSIESGVALDIAKLHSGVAIWENDELSRHGFKLKEFSKTDPHYLYNLREDLLEKLSDLLGGKHFEHCVIEDVYSGSNFTTVAVLVTLNTVIDELIFKGIISVDNFHRWKEATWMKYFRRICKIKGKPDVKYETQEILRYLNDEFSLEGNTLTNAEKEKIFFEDICDATGMLCAVAVYSATSDNEVHEKSLTMRSVWVSYQSDLNDDVLDVAQSVDYDGSKLEDFILGYCKEFPNVLFYSRIPSEKLGRFGIEHGFSFFPQGGYLLFRKKGNR